jgi:hypothetical protein
MLEIFIGMSDILLKKRMEKEKMQRKALLGVLNQVINFRRVN